jgi:hypothetical protein
MIDFSSDNANRLITSAAPSAFAEGTYQTGHGRPVQNGAGGVVGQQTLDGHARVLAHHNQGTRPGDAPSRR